MLKKLIIPVVLIGLFIVACEKEPFITNSDAGIRFSMDTLYFDTVFTSLGTATRSFTIHNPHDEYIKISELRLAKGEASVFRINVDGVPGILFEDIEIPPKDSLYVFVDATLDPNNSGDILLQQDSVITLTNSKIQDIDLVAWGQDVHLYHGEVLQTQTWTSDKPYLILDYVVVDSLETLTLEPGVRVYLHRDALFAVGGTLLALGEKDFPVSFSSDRLEKFYEDVPGQWGGIYFFSGTRDNVLNYTEITGGNFGIIVDTVMNDNPTLEINNSTIAHMSSVGLLARGAVITGYNDLIHSCGSSALALTIGGSYEFTHCTIANYGSVFTTSRQDPSVYISNYYYYNDTLPEGTVVQQVEIRDIEKASFANSIIWGGLSNELTIDKYNDGGVLNYKFDHCIGKFTGDELNLDEEHFPGLITDSIPRFMDMSNYNFQLDTLSPAKDRANPLLSMDFPLDLLGNSRLDDGKPDIGAYERIEGEATDSEN